MTTMTQWTPCMSFIWNDNMWEKREANANAISRQRQRADASELHIYPE
jgi:hypothetical protein